MTSESQLGDAITPSIPLKSPQDSRYPTMSSTSELRSIRRHEIDAKIQELEYQITSLKRERNYLASACRLPPEILCSVFEGANDPTRPITTWFGTIAHVCSRWRVIALGDPRLWTNIRFHSRGMAEEMIVRSGSLPISILHDMREDMHIVPNKSALLTALQQLHRVKRVEIFAPSQWFPEIFDQCISRPSLMLERCMVGVHTRSSQSALDNRMKVPASLFQHWPALRILKMDRCIFPWEALVHIPRLTELGISRPGNTPRSLDKLFEFLSPLADLKSLLLYNSLPPELSNESNRALQLKGLDYLFLFDDVERGAAFLDSISISPILNVDIHCFQAVADFSALTNFLARFWQFKQRHNEPLKSVGLGAPSEEYDFQLGLGSATAISDAVDVDASADLVLSFYATAALLVSRIYRSLLEALDLKSLHTVVVTIPVDRSLWLYLAFQAPQIECILHYAEGATNLLNAMIDWEAPVPEPDQTEECEFPEEAPTQAEVAPKFPKLNVLFLGSEESPVSPEPHHLLLKYVKARALIGKKVGYLNVHVERSLWQRTYQLEFEKCVDSLIYKRSSR